jgi:hypothetical protein
VFILRIDGGHQARCSSCAWAGALYDDAGQARAERGVHERGQGRD